MPFIRGDFGDFVVVLFLVLAALESYFLRRPEALLLFSRRVAGAAEAAAPILVLFVLRGWREAAVGAVFLVVLRTGFYFLYRRSLPYVPYNGPRRPVGDKMEDFFKPPVTLARLLELHGLDDLALVILDAFVVSGSTNQDGIYQRDGMYESLPSYKCVDSDKYIWYTDQRWHIGSGGPGSASGEIRVLDLEEDLEAVPTGSWEERDGSNFVSSTTISVTKTTSNRPLESIASITGPELRDLGVDGRHATQKATRLRNAYKARPRGPNYFREMLASGVVPTAAQLGTCERQKAPRTVCALTYAERRAFEEITGSSHAGRSYRTPLWYRRPYLHRLHETLKNRIVRYNTEFAAEFDAYERLELLSKEAEAADLVRQRNAAEASNRRFPRSDASRLAILEEDIEEARQDAADEEFRNRGMVFRVLTCVEINQ